MPERCGYSPDAHRDAAIAHAVRTVEGLVRGPEVKVVGRALALRCAVDADRRTQSYTGQWDDEIRGPLRERLASQGVVQRAECVIPRFGGVLGLNVMRVGKMHGFFSVFELPEGVAGPGLDRGLGGIVTSRVDTGRLQVVLSPSALRFGRFMEDLAGYTDQALNELDGPQFTMTPVQSRKGIHYLDIRLDAVGERR